MFDILMAALEWTAEYKEWDWGVYSLGIGLMIFFTYLEMWGILRQAKTMYEKRSTKAVEGEMFLYIAPYYFLCALYGVRLHGVTLIANAAITAVAQLYVLKAIVHFRPFTERERAAGSAYALMPALQLWGMQGGFDGYVYMVFAIGMWWALFEQFRKLWEEWVVGAVEIKTYLVYIIICVVWAMYAFYTHDTFFKVSMLGATAFVVAITLLWWYIKVGGRKPRSLGMPLRKWFVQLRGE